MCAYTLVEKAKCELHGSLCAGQVKRNRILIDAVGGEGVVRRHNLNVSHIRLYGTAWQGSMHTLNNNYIKLSVHQVTDKTKKYV